MLKNHLVILPSLGRVSSCGSSVRRPIVSTGDTHTYWSWAFPAYTGNGAHNTPNTEGQGARIRPNMKLWTICFASRSTAFFIPRTLAALDLASFMYFSTSNRRSRLRLDHVHTQTHWVLASIVMSGFYGHHRDLLSRRATAPTRSF